MKISMMIILAVVLTALCFGTVMAEEASKAILVVSFGTSYNDSRDITIGAIENAIAAAYPEYEVRRAFTSQIIIDKLASRDGLVIDNVAQAMDRLIADGVKNLVIQPTHVMHGFEYNDVCAEIAPYTDHFDSIIISEPLLTTPDDYWKVIDVMNEVYPRKEGEILVLMGHGTEHFADNTYAALNFMFELNGNKDVIVGTVEGYPDFDTALSEIDALQPNKIILAPLMEVAGDHANNDMAGDDADSWKSMLKAAGYDVEPMLHGLGEFAGIQQMFVEHIGDAMAKAENND